MSNKEEARITLNRPLADMAEAAKALMDQTDGAVDLAPCMGGGNLPGFLVHPSRPQVYLTNFCLFGGSVLRFEVVDPSLPDFPVIYHVSIHVDGRGIPLKVEVKRVRDLSGSGEDHES